MVKTETKLEVAILLFGSLLVIGTLVYNFLEHWSYVDSFYFSGITLTTIGYGDLYPTNDVSKIFTVIFAVSGIGIALYTFSVLTSFWVEKGSAFREKRTEQFSRIVSRFKGNENNG